MNESSRVVQKDAVNLCLSTTADRLVCFFPLLQKGFSLEVSLGRPIHALLRDEFGVPEEYIEKKVQTVFLDGKPVDDIDTALVHEGATLALAPAMPGLMGAMLRRGGYYAPMRSGITHRDDSAAREIKKGRIIVKLFGAALRDLGPMFLERGIEVDAEDLAKAVNTLPEDCREELATLDRMAGQVWLQVKALRAVTSD